MAKGITELIADFKELHPCAYKRIRDTAIDEFAERLKSESYNGYATLEDYCEDTIESVAVEDIVRIAEQMKGGAENE